MADINVIPVNMENLSEEERKQLLDLVEKANTPKSMLWKPEKDEAYFYIISTGEVARDVSENSASDETSFSIGNYFRTAEEAEFAVERLKVLHELRQYANGFHPVKDREGGFVLAYYYRSQEIEIVDGDGVEYLFADIYFETREIAQAAIKGIGEERLKKYYFGL